MYKILLVLVTLWAVAEPKSLPSYMKACKKDDPDINGCAKRNGIAAIPSLLKGDKEFKIPNLTPLRLPKIDIISGHNLQLSFKDIVLTGLETVDFRDMKIDLKKQTVEVVVAFSKLNLKGEYNMDGKILVLPLKGNGPADITFEDAVIEYSLKFDLLKKEDGKEYIDRNIKPSVKYTLKNARYRFDNLFNGDKLLGEQTNSFLNEHVSEINEELGGSISQTISAVVTNIIQLVVEVVPYDEIFV